MGTATGIESLVARLRRTGLEPTDIEVKSAAGGLPRSVPETLTAFANGIGGTLLLGLSEEDGFRPVPGFKAEAVREALAQACHDKVLPPLRMPVEIVDFEGAQIVRIDVEPIDPVDKPCFVTTQGEYYGSYIRGGDGDRRLSRYEVTQLLLNRTQPTFDLEVVPEATMDDLDPDLVQATIGRASGRAPRTFHGLDPTHALVRLGAVRVVNGVATPTIAGLLSLGRYPQQFFPQLFVAFVVVPGRVMGEPGPGGERFFDNVTIDGPIPTILLEASIALRRNMNTAAVIRGLGREDRYDYPLEVIRELVTNALMHRDYSPEGRGAHVQIELYPDRLVVKSPGGLHGSVNIDDLGTSNIVSATRNAVLAKLLTDVNLADATGETVVENRGSGLLRVMAALRRAGMSPPQFDVGPGRVHVAIPRSALLSPETIEWIGSLGLGGLTDEQHLALAMMRNSGRATSAMLRSWGVEGLAAGRALRDLVDRGVVVRSGGKRYASYHLIVTPPTAPQGPLSREARPGGNEVTRVTRSGAGIEAEVDAVLEAIRAGHTTTQQVAEHLGIRYPTAIRRINVLIERGDIQPTRPKHSSRQSYRLVQPEGARISAGDRPSPSS